MSAHPPRIERTKAILLAGRNRTYKVGPETGMKQQWAEFMKDFGKIEGQIGYTAYGVCHSFNKQADEMDYMCAVEVEDGRKIPNYLFTLAIPPRKTAIFLHDGPIEDIAKTWDKIFVEWLPGANLKVAPGPQFESYGTDLESEEARVEIFIPVD